jgi:hypothetical protein
MAVEKDLPCGGAVKAEQDVHQSRLSGPVLPEDVHNFPALEGDRDFFIGYNASECFCHPTGLEDGG